MKPTDLRTGGTVMFISGASVMVSAMATLQHSRGLGIFLVVLCVLLEFTAAVLFGMSMRQRATEEE